jgi:hypothetical protein
VAPESTLMKFVQHSSYFAHPLDLCFFRSFKKIYQKEKQTKGVKGATRKIYRALPLMAQNSVPLIPDGICASVLENSRHFPHFVSRSFNSLNDRSRLGRIDMNPDLIQSNQIPRTGLPDLLRAHLQATTQPA